MEKSKVKDIILETKSPNLYLLPAHIDLVGAELEFVNEEDREQMMKNALSEIVNDFDYIIIDCASFFRNFNIKFSNCC